MPRNSKDSHAGWDLDLEYPFWDSNGERYFLGSAGSFIQFCPICADERFRVEFYRLEECWTCHCQLVFNCRSSREQYIALCDKLGIKLTTVEERRTERLEFERTHPWNYCWGNTTEADYPLGYLERPEAVRAN